VDASFQDCRDTRHSTSGFVFVLYGTAFHWGSRKQTTLALSTAVAEYVAASVGAQEAVWVAKLLRDLGLPDRPVLMRCDNQATVKIVENPVSDGKTKYVESRYHYVREAATSGAIKISFVGTKDNLADCFTKVLPREAQRSASARLGLT
jgi:hypothetical protein